MPPAPPAHTSSGGGGAEAKWGRCCWGAAPARPSAAASQPGSRRATDAALPRRLAAPLLPMLPCSVTTPSGALTLDLALGGGYPKGRVVEIFGPGGCLLASVRRVGLQAAGPRRLVEEPAGLARPRALQPAAPSPPARLSTLPCHAPPLTSPPAHPSTQHTHQSRAARRRWRCSAHFSMHLLISLSSLHTHTHTPHRRQSRAARRRWRCTRWRRCRRRAARWR